MTKEMWTENTIDLTVATKNNEEKIIPKGTLIRIKEIDEKNDKIYFYVPPYKENGENIPLEDLQVDYHFQEIFADLEDRYNAIIYSLGRDNIKLADKVKEKVEIESNSGILGLSLMKTKKTKEVSRFKDFLVSIDAFDTEIKKELIRIDNENTAFKDSDFYRGDTLSRIKKLFFDAYKELYPSNLEELNPLALKYVENSTKILDIVKKEDTGYKKMLEIKKEGVNEKYTKQIVEELKKGQKVIDSIVDNQVNVSKETVSFIGRLLNEFDDETR